MTKQAKSQKPKQDKVLLSNDLFAIVKRANGSFCVTLASNLSRTMYSGSKDWCYEWFETNGSLA